MKALTLTAYNEFSYGDAPEPDLPAGNVLVRVGACGICGSDVHGMDGSSGRRIPPIIMGHEAAGTVESVGEGVDAWKPGDRVTFDSMLSCGECDDCRSGRSNLCGSRRILGVSCDEYRQHGAFAELVSVPAHIVLPVPAGLEFEEACFAEPVSVAVHAVARVPVKAGDTAVVIGAGIIGLLIIQVLKAAGCGRVIAVDLDVRKLALARELGADDTLVSDRDKVLGHVRGATGGDGADIAMEVVGVGPTLALAVDCVRKGGSVGLVGNLAANAELPLQAVVTREISLYGSCASAGKEFAEALRLIQAGDVRVKPLISATADLAEGGGWFDRLYDNQEGLVKVILKPG